MASRIWKLTKLTALSLIGFLLVLIGSGLAYRAYQQHEIAKTLSINTPNGIDEGMFVKIGGIDQWITIRGRDRGNPVLLILHGGPGATTSPLAPNFLGWESDFTIVQWDQRGAGKTFGKSGALDKAITIDRMAQGGLELSDFVRRHLQKDKIILLGWSWGSTLGIEMVKERPELFYAYVGTGQIVNVRKNYAFGYSRLLAEDRARGDQTAISDLEAIGPPPYDSIRKLGVHTRQALAHEVGAPSTLDTVSAILFAPGYTLRDFRDWVTGFDSSQSHFFGDTMSGPFMDVDLPALGTDFAIPIFVFQGADDNIAPPELARAYVDGITAPQKQFIPITGAGHVAMMARSNEFLKLLDEWVRPLAIQPKAVGSSTNREMVFVKS
jgi:pimeloyl-ACP methyl ester carboxylesterase